jgi:hypothetical protein
MKKMIMLAHKIKNNIIVMKDSNKPNKIKMIIPFLRSI